MVLSEKNIDEILEKVGSVSTPVNQGLITVDEKKEVLSEIIQFMETNSPPDKYLKCLRVLCREAAGSEPFFTPQVLFSQQAFKLLLASTSIETGDISKISSEGSLDAMKCVANIQSMFEPSRKMFCESALIDHLIPILKLRNYNISTLFLLLRLTFFATAVSKEISRRFFDSLIFDLLADIIDEVESGKIISDSQYNVSNVITEVLTITFNVTLSKSTGFFTPTIVELDSSDPEICNFKRILSAIIKLGIRSEINDPPLSYPHSQIINALINFPFHSLVELWFPNENYQFCKVLMEIFERTMQYLMTEGNEKLDDEIWGMPTDELVLPLLLVLKKMAGSPIAQKLMRDRFLPQDLDRTKPLTEGTHITAALVRSMTSVSLMNTKDVICDFLVTLLENDIQYFVRYIGYANCAGFLFNRGISQPPKATTFMGIPDNVDIMTGCYIKEEKRADPLQGMTEEEKDRETEKLFVLFDRLNKSGVIKTVNK